MRGLALAVLLSALMVGVRLALADTIGPTGALVILAPAILGAAWLGGLWPGLLATALIGLAAAYWFIPEPASFRFASPADAIQAVGVFFLGAMISLGFEVSRASRRRLRDQAARQAALTAASARLQAATTEQAVLQVATDQARAILRVRQAVSSLTLDSECAQMLMAASLDRAAPWAPDGDAASVASPGGGVEQQVCRTNRPMRLDAAQLRAHPAWRGTDGAPQAVRAPVRDWLAAPLVSRDGGNLGVIQVAGRLDGAPFSAEDEGQLAQLAAIAAVAVENAWLYASLREADARKDEFLAMLGHELRNPLSPLRNALHLIRRTAALSPPAQDAVGMAERQVQQMTRLVDDLLNIARISSGIIELRREPLDLRGVVHRAAESVQAELAAADVTLMLDLPDEPLPMQADAVRLVQVVTNLLNNAAKFTDPGGRVDLRAERDGACATVRVRDTGIGIEPHLLPRLFDVFTQLHDPVGRNTSGLGLGLALVKRLVELHGGTVQARSEGLGRGAEFTVRLPLAVAGTGKAAAGPQVGQPAGQAWPLPGHAGA